MTTLELRVNLSDRLAALLKDAMRRHCSLARRAMAACRKPLSMDEIQAEVNEVRKARRAKRSAA
jgi:hypothetical protein